MKNLTTLSSKATAAVTAFALSLVLISGTVTVPATANATTYVSTVA